MATSAIRLLLLQQQTAKVHTCDLATCLTQHVKRKFRNTNEKFNEFFCPITAFQ